VVFELSPPSTAGGSWTFSLLYSFAGGLDGCDPVAGLSLGKTGALYGTTQIGGSFRAGTVFRLTPPASQSGAWSETVLYRFTDSSTDGAGPDAPLILSGGALYGTTRIGGPANGGTAFKLIP
jgi:uncharacterized repeat protein (TIGR03803 family)